MLPKSYRLSRPEILMLRAKGKHFNTKNFSLIYRPNELGHLRVSVEISLRVDKRATRRNRLRRQIFSTIEKTSLITKPIDLLVVIKPVAGNHLAELTKLLASSQFT